MRVGTHTMQELEVSCPACGLVGVRDEQVCPACRASGRQAAPFTNGSRYVAYAAVCLTVIAWGASFVVARSLLQAGSHQVSLSPTALATLRFTIASLFLCVPLGMAIARRELGFRDVLKLALLGQLAFPLYFWLQYTGIQKTNASIASILVVGLIPLASASLGPLMSEERFDRLRLLALLAGLAGTVVIVTQRPARVSLASGFVFGALCLVSNAFAFALYGHLSKRLMYGIRPLVMTAGTMTAGTSGLLLLSLADPGASRLSDVTKLTGAQWAAVLYLALVCSLLAYFAYNFALSRIDASQAAVYLYFEPVVAVALSIPLLGERLTWQTVMGALLIAASVAAMTATRSFPGRMATIRNEFSGSLLRWQKDRDAD